MNFQDLVVSVMSLKTFKIGKEFMFFRKYRCLSDVLTDNDLASLGDAYINFIYSLYLSKRSGRPIGKKVESFPLAGAIQKAGLRRFLASRTDRHKQADAAEALLVYGWIVGAISLEESVQILMEKEKVEEAFSSLLETVVKRCNLDTKK